MYSGGGVIAVVFLLHAYLAWLAGSTYAVLTLLLFVEFSKW